jgi:putative beta-lysine N-acetyltransferase
MQDRTETIGQGSIIQHGKFNDRIYLMKLHREDCPGIIDILGEIAQQNAYSKIFCKVPGWAAPVFFSDGFVMEGYIPGFYREKDAAFFLSKYLSSDRLLGLEKDLLDELGKLLRSRVLLHKPSEIQGTGDKVIRLDSIHADQMAGIYRKVFLSYPFPIHDPDYIIRTMKQNMQYFGIERKGRLVALASAEIDRSGHNAEMTDFATLPAYRGNKFSIRLLAGMEAKMKEQGISTLYTIARLCSIPMNKTFLKLQYRYAGTLIKNTNIAGKIESMNVYYKHI